MDELFLMAELGIAYAGFLAIFLVFARREGRFSPADGLRVRSVIVASFGTVFAALLPLALRLYGLDEVVLWRIASIVALLMMILAGTHVGREQLALSTEERVAVGLAHSLISWGLSAAGALLLVANAVGAVGEPGVALYVSALVCVLAVATSNFVTIAFQRLL